MNEMAKELSTGGVYTAWLIVVILSGVIVFLFRELQKAIKDDSKEVVNALTKVNETQQANTSTLGMMLSIVQAIQQAFLQGRG